MVRKLADAKNESSNRRKFFHKLVGAAALGSISSLILSHKVERVKALDGTGATDQIAYWSDADTITGSDRLKWDNTNNNFAAGYAAVTSGVQNATISGGGGGIGETNRVTDRYGTVGGGRNNQAGDNTGTTTDKMFATVGGGQSNTASGSASTVGGGESNTASGVNSTVSGGFLNTASGNFSTIGGGELNTAAGEYSTIAGGYSNATSGHYSAISGGAANSAAGDFSFAAGRRAKIAAAHDGAFLFADQNDYNFNSAAANEFAIRCTGGARFVTGIDGSGNPTQTIVMNTSGFLGVGTTTPTACIHGVSTGDKGVYGQVTASSGYTYGVYGESASYIGTGVYGKSGGTNGTGVYGFAEASTGSAYGVCGASNSQNGIGVIGLGTNANSISMVARGTDGQIGNLQEWQNFDYNALSVIDQNGFLGIGTSAPVTALHVKSSSSNPAVRIENENNFVGQFIYCYSNTASHIPFFSGRRARGTITSPLAVQTNDILMRYGGAGYGTSAFPGGNRAILEFKAAQNWTDTNQGTYITFSTTPNNSSTAAERMRITDAGEVVPPTDNTGSIGTASRRWSLVRATTVTSGDLVFENGVRATEEGKGIAFKNDAGEKIAVLDREGNFYVKGEVRKLGNN